MSLDPGKTCCIGIKLNNLTDYSLMLSHIHLSVLNVANYCSGQDM